MRTAPLQLPDTAMHGARLEISLDAIAANYRKIAAIAAPARTSAAIKADAYGLGLKPVAQCLASAGCDIFFVAHYAEGVALRAVLPRARIYILHGLPVITEHGACGQHSFASTAHGFASHGLRPVINSLPELLTWRKMGMQQGGAILNFDTGMSRLGLSTQETAQLVSSADLLEDVVVDFIMSHLACADEPDHPLNAQQLAAFNALRQAFPGIPASLANTAGTLLGAAYRHDLVRPGIGLYGGSPSGAGESPFEPAVRLYARILQVRDVDSVNYVGYGASYRPAGPARIAVAGIGYADGYMRALSNLGVGYIGNQPVPLVGRISMDMCTFDISGIAQTECAPGCEIELIGPNAPLERAAALAGTINYEILTHLGRRFQRSYSGPGTAA